MRQKPKHKPTPIPKQHSSRERLFREAFFPDRKSRKPLLERGKSARVGPGRGMVLLWVSLVCVFVFTVLFSDFHVIRTVSVSGAGDVPSETIQTYVRNGLSGKRYGIFSRDNFFSAPVSEIRRGLSREFPKLKAVSITRRFPDRISVEVTERERLLVWCSGGPCYLIGENGQASDAVFAETAENEPFLVRVIDESARPVTIGDPLLSPETAEAILRLEKKLRENTDFGITAPFRSPSRVSGEIRVMTTQGWDLLMSLDIAPDKTIASLRLVLEKEIPIEKRPSLRYVDLRTENRAFFAYEGEKHDGEENGNGVTDGGSPTVDHSSDTKKTKKD